MVDKSQPVGSVNILLEHLWRHPLGKFVVFEQVLLVRFLVVFQVIDPDIVRVVHHHSAFLLFGGRAIIALAALSVCCAPC